MDKYWYAMAEADWLLGETCKGEQWGSEKYMYHPELLQTFPNILFIKYQEKSSTVNNLKYVNYLFSCI